MATDFNAEEIPGECAVGGCANPAAATAVLWLKPTPMAEVDSRSDLLAVEIGLCSPTHARALRMGADLLRLESDG